MSPPRHRDRRSPSPPRRRHENFHHVAPPKRMRAGRTSLHHFLAVVDVPELRGFRCIILFLRGSISKEPLRVSAAPLSHLISKTI